MATSRLRAFSEFTQPLLMELIRNKLSEATREKQNQFTLSRDVADRAEAARARQAAADQALRGEMVTNPLIALRMKQSGHGPIAGEDPSTYAPSEGDISQGLTKDVEAAKSPEEIPSNQSILAQFQNQGQSGTQAVSIPNLRGGAVPMTLPTAPANRVASIAAERRKNLETSEREKFLQSNTNYQSGVGTRQVPGGGSITTERSGPQEGARLSDTLIGGNTKGANEARRANAFFESLGNNMGSLEETPQPGETKSIFAKKMDLASAGSAQGTPLGLSEKLTQLADLENSGAVASNLEKAGGLIRTGSEFAAGSAFGSTATNAVVNPLRELSGNAPISTVDRQYIQAAHQWNNNYTKLVSGVQFREEEKSGYLNTFFRNAGDPPEVAAQKTRARELFQLSVRAYYTHGEDAQGQIIGDMINRGYLTPEQVTKYFRVTPGVTAGINKVVR